jgi:hypothetical protein
LPRRPTVERASWINETYEELEVGGFLAALDFLRITGFDEQCSCLNWIEDRYNALIAGGPVFTSDRGFYGNGNNSGVGTAELLTGYNPRTSLGKFSQDSAFMYIYVNASPSPTLGSAFDYMIGNGSSGSGASFIRPLAGSSNAVSCRLNSAATALITLDADKRSRLGSKAISRLNATEITLFANGVKQGAALANASALPANAEMRILHAGTSAATFGQDQGIVEAFGRGFTDQEAADFDGIILSRITLIGGN